MKYHIFSIAIGHLNTLNTHELRSTPWLAARSRDTPYHADRARATARDESFHYKRVALFEFVAEQIILEVL